MNQQYLLGNQLFKKDHISSYEFVVNYTYKFSLCNKSKISWNFVMYDTLPMILCPLESIFINFNSGLWVSQIYDSLLQKIPLVKCEKGHHNLSGDNQKGLCHEKMSVFNEILHNLKCGILH